MNGMGSIECEWRDAAWSFVLGADSAHERDLFSEHLLAGCGACGSEVARAREVIAELDVAVAERDVATPLAPTSNCAGHRRKPAPASAAGGAATPFSDLVGENAVHATASSCPGVSLVLASEFEGWCDSEVEGVHFKLLKEDGARGYATALVRMDPGSSYPPHRHGGAEECLVLSGDLTFGGHQLGAGDYQVADKGSVHPVQATKGGCLLLIVSSLDDEPL